MPSSAGQTVPLSHPLPLCSETPAPKGPRESESICSCRLPPDLAKELWSRSGLRKKPSVHGKRSKHTDLAVTGMMRPPKMCLSIPEVPIELSVVHEWLPIHLLLKWFCVQFTCRLYHCCPDEQEKKVLLPWWNLVVIQKHLAIQDCWTTWPSSLPEVKWGQSPSDTDPRA